MARKWRSDGSEGKLQFPGTGNFVFQSERECWIIGWITTWIKYCFSQSGFPWSPLLLLGLWNMFARRVRHPSVRVANGFTVPSPTASGMRRRPFGFGFGGGTDNHSLSVHSLDTCGFTLLRENVSSTLLRTIACCKGLPLIVSCRLFFTESTLKNSLLSVKDQTTSAHELLA